MKNTPGPASSDGWVLTSQYSSPRDRGSKLTVGQVFFKREIILIHIRKNVWPRGFKKCRKVIEIIKSRRNRNCCWNKKFPSERKGYVVQINRSFSMQMCRILYYATQQPTLQLIKYKSYKLNQRWSIGRWLQ